MRNVTFLPTSSIQIVLAITWKKRRKREGERERESWILARPLGTCVNVRKDAEIRREGNVFAEET